MTVETTVMIEGEEKCGVEMRSDLSPKSVGGGGGDGGGGECNGGVENSKDDYVFVNDCDVTLDDHGEVVVEANVDLKEGGDGDRLDLDMCNGFSGKVDDNVVVMEDLKVENGIIVEEESDGGDELMKENGEIEIEKEEGVIEDKEVVVENGDRIENEDEVAVNERDLEVVEESDVKSKVNGVKVAVEGDECNASVDDIACSSLDHDKININGACDSLQNGSAIVEIEPQVPCDEIVVQHPEEIENQTNESEKLKDEVRKSEVVEDNVNSRNDEVLATESEPLDGVAKGLEPIEVDVVHPSQEDDHIEMQPPDEEAKASGSGGAEVLLPDDVITEQQSTDCPQQDLQDADNGELGPVETEAEVGEQGDLDPSGMRGSQDLESLDSEGSVCELQQSVENQDDSDLIPESEECTEPQGIPEQSEVADTESNLALTASELDGPALETTGQCDETTPELAQEVTGTLDTSTVDEQSDKFDKSADDHELDMVHGEGKIEVIAQVERSLECSVQEASPPDSVVLDNGSVDGVNKEVSSEDVISFNKATTVEATANSLLLKSADEVVLDEDSKDLDASDLQDGLVDGVDVISFSKATTVEETANSLLLKSADEVVLDEESKDLDASDLQDGVPGNDVTVPESAQEVVISFSKATTVEEAANSLMPKSADEAVIDEESKDLDASDLQDGVPGNDVTVPESSHDSGNCLTFEGGDLTAPLGSSVDLPVLHDTDMIKEPRIVDDGSYAGESSSQANLENSNDALPYSDNGTEIEIEPVTDEFHDLSKNGGSEGTLRFGAFVCQTKANGVTTSLADVNAQIITDVVPQSSLEGSGVSTSLTDADAQILIDEISASPLEESRVDSADGETADPARTPFRWLIKVPRLDNVEFERIKKCQIELAKKTQDRDDFRKVYLERVEIYREVMAKFQAAKAEKEVSYQSMMAKKREIDSAQSVLKLARDGNTVERIDGQILNMERRIQHETLDLAEEKRLVREIKQLNHQRDQLAADTQGQQEVHQAVGRRVETEEQLKVLRKEMEVLREKYGKTFENCKAAERKCGEESKLKQKSEAEFKSLARIREAAYDNLRTLKQQAYEKNKPCYSYRDARTAIFNLKAGEEESLEQLCVNQVENFMELWNKSDEFRKEYIRCNMRSTLRRFNALDGRDLGVDEKKPVLEDSSDNGVASAKVNSVATVLTSERDFPLVVKKAKEEDSSKKVIEQKNTNAIAKKRGETISGNSLAESFGRLETEEKEEGPKLSKEEEELAKKAEYKRREEEAERLKEQRRLEEKAKAQEALERKKRMAEKAQARAKFKAEKEAEEKKKEREKRAKKKGKKNGLRSEPAEVEPAQAPESSTETIRELEVKEKPVTVTKKSHKPAALLYTKQVKTTKSIPAPPAPLRNRGKRRIPQWAWWLVLAILTALLIFPLGSIDIVGVLRPFVSGSSK